MLVVAAALVAAQAITPAAPTITHTADRIVERDVHELAPMANHELNTRAWEWAPLGCELVDAGTALIGRSSNPGFVERGPVSQHLIDKPLAFVGFKVARGVLARFLLRPLLTNDKPALRTLGKAFSGGSCATSLGALGGGALSNVRAW